MKTHAALAAGALMLSAVAETAAASCVPLSLPHMGPECLQPGAFGPALPASASPLLEGLEFELDIDRLTPLPSLPIELDDTPVGVLLDLLPDTVSTHARDAETAANQPSGTSGES